MKHISLFLLLIFTCYNAEAQKNFEGLVKFSTHISTTNIAPQDFKKDLDEKYGDSLIMYYSVNGNFKRVHKNTAKFGADSQLYIANKGVLYLQNKRNEIDSLNVKINSLQLLSEKKIANETIMGLDCNCYQYLATSMYQQNVILTYCFNKKTPKINEELYSKHTDFFLYNFYKLAKRPYLKFSIQTEEFNITYLANELKSQSLSQDLFHTK
ncbi:hypothetical protein MCEGE10_01991 [Flavobacteriaceae bacterium]|jgi:hypothetical protein